MRGRKAQPRCMHELPSPLLTLANNRYSQLFPTRRASFTHLGKRIPRRIRRLVAGTAGHSREKRRVMSSSQFESTKDPATKGDQPDTVTLPLLSVDCLLSLPAYQQL